MKNNQPNLLYRLLTAKHWQIFLLTYGILFFCQIFVMSIVFIYLLNNPNPEPLLFIKIIFITPIISIFSSFVHLAWLWAVAICLQKRIPSEIKMNISMFKILFIIPIIYIVVIIIIIILILNLSILTDISNNSDVELYVIAVFFIILPIHLIAMSCTIHTLYFVAKTFKTAELQRETTFSDFVAEFFLIWFYPVGIWIIQPKINELIKFDDNNITIAINEDNTYSNENI